MLTKDNYLTIKSNLTIMWMPLPVFSVQFSVYSRQTYGQMWLKCKLEDEAAGSHSKSIRALGISDQTSFMKI